MANAIELVEVVKELGSVRVLDGVDLAVPEGAVTVLLGPSGAGKTVTVKHVLGLLQPTSGVVRVEGRDLAQISEAELYELRRHMGVVLQGTLPFTCGLFYSLTVYENVAYPLRERTRWSSERIDEVTVAALDTVGLRDRAGAMPSELSAGMCKRAALARAFALEPNILIVDDFDSGLDSVRIKLLCELLRETHERTGGTFLLTTHDMRAARELADYAAVIHEGRVVASGTAAAVFASSEPLVHQLVEGDPTGPLQLRDV